MKLGLLLLFSISVAENENILDTKLIEPMDDLDMELERYPKLEELLPSLTQKTSKDIEHIPDAIVKSVSIDIDKINMDKFKKKMETIIDKLAVHEEPKNDTRRQAVIPGTEGWNVYTDAMLQMIRRKTIDCMLQLLYMTRHKIQTMTSNKSGTKYFNTKDTGFRIAFTFRRLGRIYNKLMQVYTYGNYKAWSWDHIDPQVVLHAKATRLHVDFQYLWWVMIKVDNKYKQRQAEAKKKQKKKFQAKAKAQGMEDDEDDPNYPEGYKMDKMDRKP